MMRRFELRATRRPARMATGWFAVTLLVSSAAAQSRTPPDLTGVWLSTTPRTGHAPMPELTARAQAELDVYDPLDDPVIRCVQPGFPRSGLIIYPLQIVQTDELILFLYESFATIRRIYMDGRSMPDYWPPSKSGFSVGHSEGDELVIETTNYSPGALVITGVQQFGDMSVVERYRLVDNGHGLQGEVAVTAPQTFDGTWVRHFTWELDPDGMIFEAICDPADSRFIE